MEFCKPRTKYNQKIAKGEKSINVLDNACEKYDLAYKNKNSKARNTVDKKLYKAAESYLKELYLSTYFNFITFFILFFNNNIKISNTFFSHTSKIIMFFLKFILMFFFNIKYFLFFFII